MEDHAFAENDQFGIDIKGQLALTQQRRIGNRLALLAPKRHAAMQTFLERLDGRLSQRLSATERRPLRIVIVGAGAAGLEIACCLTRRLDALQKDRTREINRLKAGKHPKQVQTSMRQMIAFQDKQIAKLQAEIQDHIDQHLDLKQKQELLTSIPGIGDKKAAVVLGELPDINSFNTAKQVTAFAGLTPEQLQSCKSLRQRGFTKMGSKHLRTALFMPALVAKQKNPLLALYAQRLEAAGKSKMTVVGADVRKLLHLIYGILKSQKPYDPNYLTNVQNAV